MSFPQAICLSRRVYLYDKVLGVAAAGGNSMDWAVTSKNSNQFAKVDMDPKSVTIMNAAIISHIDPTDMGLGSIEKGNTVLTSKPRKKTMTSVYLKYFETAVDGKSRRCKFCGQSYSIATATGNLGRHLSSRHPGYDKMGDSSDNSAPEPATVTKKPQTQVKLPLVELDHLNWLLIKWLLVASLPPSTLAEQFLMNSFKFLNPLAEVWSGEKFQAVMLYNLETKILAITHDNSPNATHACHTLRGDMDSQKLTAVCSIPCAAHTLNSIINEGLRNTKSVILKIREFVLELNSSPEILEDFLQFTTAYQEGNWKFPLDASARWSGSYQMLDVGCKASNSIDSVIRKHEEQLGSRLLLNSTEKNVINIVHNYLEPFHKTISNICANKVLTLGMLLFFMDHISDTISASKDSRQTPEWLKASAEDMHVKALSYSDQVCNPFAYMASILDPRIKVELIPDYLNLTSFLDEVRNHFITNYSVSYFPLAGNSYELNDEGSTSFAEEIARKKRRAGMSSATDELTQYLSEPPVSMPTDVVEWWKVNSSRYPRLSLMARDFLAVQSTAVHPEDVFSAKGDENVRQRFLVRRNDARALLCVRSWVQNGMKLRYGSAVIDVERIVEMGSERVSDRKRKS
ncbi:BED zinc finger [Striga asiatica]|uniref:BED zinc finger n=1 Tax=Striga asiatica TaxID=4170 RepID=A0A5A7PI56_STRAF|nr:BED zinc finger [Striga asiatica]